MSPKLAYHTLTPTTDPSGAIVTNRWKVVSKKKVALVPTQIAEGTGIEDIGLWDLGALFIGAFDRLPLTSCMIVPECDTSPGGDPTQVSLRPMMMKLLVRASVVVPPGKAVQLV